jgi:hypothetical protein
VSPDAFIEDFHDRRRAAGLGDEHGVIVELSSSLPSVVSFDQFIIAAVLRGQGLASRVVDLLTQMSDEEGFALVLIPRRLDDAGLSDAELTAWYRRRGFVDAPTDNTPRQTRREPTRVRRTGSGG